MHSAHGVLTLRSPWPLEATLDRLQTAFAAKGLKVFADIDQQAEARAVGLDQPPMHLLLVGNPRAGAPIMTANPLVGIDLPLKVLAWEATPGLVEVAVNSADWLADRHELTAEQVQGLHGLEMLVKATLTA
ncbi:MAG TPA: DUF302 domain-containing protein [Gemmataceae bacterium]|jgi:uncharacterized protein (DUF302 family)|nr:DUF302 domain-containing protein [Gemmataceae bacterium]